MKRRYVTADVFTETKFGGNPLAVVLDAEGLDGPAMQAIAREFNYSETTFVLPPANPAHTAHVRIFTPVEELPFAGHPNVGTAYALARIGTVFGKEIGSELVFEEAAGLVPIRILRQGGAIAGAELTAPQPLSRGAIVPAAHIAASLGIPEAAVVTMRHAPQFASVGTGFIIAELQDRATLAGLRPDAAAFATRLRADGTSKLLVYVRGRAGELDARMLFAVPDIREDPATGSANAALAALLAELDPAPSGTFRLRITQGEDMGRPSLLLTVAVKSGGRVTETRIGGSCVPVMEGLIDA